MKRYILGLLALEASAAITIDTSTKYQKIDGFGVSQAFGRAAEFQAANSTLQKQALDLLFSTDTGAGLSIIRNFIPSSVGATIEPTSPGAPGNTPNYTWDGSDQGQVWFSQQAISYGVKTIYADAWSAPGFMKTSGDEATAGYLCGTTGHTCSTGDWRQAYANYLVQYATYYKQAGIDITYLGFLNEPDYTVSYSQMQISSNAQEAIDFIPTLYSTVKSSGLSAKITCCDAMGWSDQKTYTTALVAAGMESYLGLITSHTYSSEATSALGTTLPSWVSEASVSSGAFVTTWYSSGAANEGMTWANKLATAFVSANISAYVYWEGFEIGQTQSASHLIDTSSGTALPSGIFYAFSMWSRFIRPGAYRVSTSGTVTSVATAAFVNTDGSVVVVLTNSGSTAQSADLAVSGAASAQAWLTDNTHQVAATTVTVGSSAVTVAIPAYGVVTVKITTGSSSGSSSSSSSTTTTSVKVSTSTTTTTTTTKSTTTTTTTTTSATGATQTHWGQCGGIGWTGATACASPYTCQVQNDYYSQCL